MKSLPLPDSRVDPRTYDLQGFTIVLELFLSFDPADGDSIFRLMLADDHTPGSRVIEAEFLGVHDLHLAGFGGGLNQVLCLSIFDASDQQIDRICYRVEELERGNLRFLCRDFRINRIPTGPTPEPPR